MQEASPPAPADHPEEVPCPGFDERNPALEPIGILAGFESSSLLHLASFGTFETFAAGAEIMPEGALQSRFYIIVTGQVEIVTLGSGNDLRLCVAEPGECIGEVNLLEPGPATATVRAERDAVLWSMDNADLRRYLTAHIGGCGALLIGITSCLSRRLRQANDLIRQHHIPPEQSTPSERAITADDAPVALGFFDRLTRSLAVGKKVRISTEIKM